MTEPTAAANSRSNAPVAVGAEHTTDDLPAWLVRELRTDHAGETGAIAIYRGILPVSLEAEVRAFAARHLATERRHLVLIETLLPTNDRSTLVPVWRLAGFITGAVPVMLGPEAV